MPERKVILHYHLFKNAGTSVDRILQSNFGNRWVTREFPMSGGDNSALVAEWIQDNPKAIAFSSHTMMGPIPQISNTRILTLLFLRDPISRIISAYEFEKRQRVETLGAQLAKTTDLAGYVDARLAIPGDRQCRDFQTYRLSSLLPGNAPELDRAKQMVRKLSLVGRVESFEKSIAKLSVLLSANFGTFSAKTIHANRSSQQSTLLTDDLMHILRTNNQRDLELLAFHQTLEEGNES